MAPALGTAIDSKHIVLTGGGQVFAFRHNPSSILQADGGEWVTVVAAGHDAPGLDEPATFTSIGAGFSANDDGNVLFGGTARTEAGKSVDDVWAYAHGQVQLVFADGDIVPTWDGQAIQTLANHLVPSYPSGGQDGRRTRLSDDNLAAFVAGTSAYYADLDIPAVNSGTIAGTVWHDAKKMGPNNGIQDEHDTPVEGIQVTLLGEDDEVVAGPVMTDALGEYRFTGVQTGMYRVEFVPPEGAGFVSRESGDDLTVDSNPYWDGKTPLFALAPGQINETIDAGIVYPNTAPVGELLTETVDLTQWLGSAGAIPVQVRFTDDGQIDADSFEPEGLGVSSLRLDGNNGGTLGATFDQFISRDEFDNEIVAQYLLRPFRSWQEYHGDTYEVFPSDNWPRDTQNTPVDTDVSFGTLSMGDFPSNVIVVNSTGDAADLDPGDDRAKTGGRIDRDGDGQPDEDEVTLRSAIMHVNLDPEANEILFDIPTTDANHNAAADIFTIRPATALPAVTEALLIDGFTQPGATPAQEVAGDLPDPALLKIEISGDDAGTDGLILEAATTVRGLTINGFDINAGAGIVIRSDQPCNIYGNHIGTDPSGKVARGNYYGIFIDNSTGNVIGGDGIEAVNVISDNHTGVYIRGADASGNRVLGNAIGGSADPEDELPLDALNNVNGVYIHNANGNTIGSPETVLPQFIQGGGLVAGEGVGVQITADPAMEAGANLVQANLIQGFFTGVWITGAENEAHFNLVGGSDSGEGNTVVENYSGIVVTDASDNIIEGNGIGVFPDDTPGGNFHVGVFIDGGARNTVGGTKGTTPLGPATGAANVIVNTVGTVYDEFSWRGNGVLIAGDHADGNRVEGNYIGVGPDGTTAMPNRDAGVAIRGAWGTVVGGDTPAARNIISGNNGHGIAMHDLGGVQWEPWHPEHPTVTRIIGNFIGVNSAGIAALPNTDNGVYVTDIADTLHISEPGNGNIISGNFDSGIHLADGAILEGNVIGRGIGDEEPPSGIPNAVHGVHVESTGGVVIGTAEAGNLIASNGPSWGSDEFGSGIFIDDGSCEITNNTIAENWGYGVSVGSPLFDGFGEGGSSGHGIIVENWIGGNALAGIRLAQSREFTGSEIRRNGIGIDEDDEPLPNGDGIVILAADRAVIEQNAIMYNVGAGVLSKPTVSLSSPEDAGYGNRISENFFQENGGLAIDLIDPNDRTPGVTPNDPFDADTGPNGLMNFPVLSAVTDGASTGTVRIVGYVPGSAADAPYRVEFFKVDQPDPSGHGEANMFIGAIDNVELVAGGLASFDEEFTPFGGSIAEGWYVIATATGHSGTSEFSEVIRFGDGVLNNSVTGNDGFCDDQALEPCTTSSGNGSYLLLLDTGQYTMRQVVQSGWEQVFPAADAGHAVELVSTTEPLVAQNFGNSRLSISGWVFSDLDADGVPDTNEPGMNEWSIYLHNDGGQLIDETTTDADGNFRFIDFQPGIYTVTAESRDGWLQTTLDPEPIDVRQHSVSNVEFGTYMESWQNPADPLDVDGKDGVTPLDVLIIITYINSHPGDTSLPSPPESPPPYLDVNNDGSCTPLDVLQVIQYINSQSFGTAEGEQTSSATGAFLIGPLSRSAIPEVPLPPGHEASALNTHESPIASRRGSDEEPALKVLRDRCSLLDRPGRSDRPLDSNGNRIFDEIVDDLDTTFAELDAALLAVTEEIEAVRNRP